jgi:hypothetical protein
MRDQISYSYNTAEKNVVSWWKIFYF